MVSYERRLKRSPSLFQGEESYGYKELVEAVKQVSSLPAAICSVKEVWAEYNLSSDAIALFRKVLHIFSVINDVRCLFSWMRWWCCVWCLQADNHQENIDLSEAKDLKADGLVNFISANEIRYITEYSQVVGPTHVFFTVLSFCLILSVKLTFQILNKKQRSITQNPREKVDC